MIWSMNKDQQSCPFACSCPASACTDSRSSPEWPVFCKVLKSQTLQHWEILRASRPCVAASSKKGLWSLWKIVHLRPIFTTCWVGVLSRIIPIKPHLRKNKTSKTVTFPLASFFQVALKDIETYLLHKTLDESSEKMTAFAPSFFMIWRSPLPEVLHCAFQLQVSCTLSSAKLGWNSIALAEGDMKSSFGSLPDPCAWQGRSMWSNEAAECGHHQTVKTAMAPSMEKVHNWCLSVAPSSFSRCQEGQQATKYNVFFDTAVLPGCRSYPAIIGTANLTRSFPWALHKLTSLQGKTAAFLMQSGHLVNSSNSTSAFEAMACETGAESWPKKKHRNPMAFFRKQLHDLGKMLGFGFQHSFKWLVYELTKKSPSSQICAWKILSCPTAPKQDPKFYVFLCCPWISSSFRWS